MGASTRTGEQDGIATATLASGELEATFATGAGIRRAHPGACPLVEAYNAAFAVEVGSTMGA